MNINNNNNNNNNNRWYSYATDKHLKNRRLTIFWKSYRLILPKYTKLTKSKELEYRAELWKESEFEEESTNSENILQNRSRDSILCHLATQKMPNDSKNGKQKVSGASSRRSPRLSIGADERKTTIAQPLGTPGTSRQLQPGKRVRSQEEMEASKKDRKNESVEVRNGEAYYDTDEGMEQKPDKKEKNVKAISGVCVENEDDKQLSFNPKETSTESETDLEETVSKIEYPINEPSADDNLKAMANSMALAFQTEAVRQSLRRVFDP